MYIFVLKKIQTVRKGSIAISFPYEAVKQNTVMVGKEFYKFLHYPSSFGPGYVDLVIVSVLISTSSSTFNS